MFDPKEDAETSLAKAVAAEAERRKQEDLELFQGITFGFVGHPGSSGGGCDGHTPPPVLGGKL